MKLLFATKGTAVFPFKDDNFACLIFGEQVCAWCKLQIIFE